ncbi:alpha beta-hydrolase [Fusarium albosuccineum]|uniref:Alpha beta-hydrolase n=1 Tax=Fusarium albosuccineum TaxID=1237068 RepID=A0A8H4LDF9_9HYPO|nr:alpha beta-hydrolase [Fusarium albosuccineum]
MAASPLSQGDHFFEADSVRFHYRVRGTGPLAIIPSVGWGLPAAYLWNGMGPLIEDKHTVLYLEPRGTGQSSRPDDATTMNAKVMAEDVEHLRLHLGLEVLPLLVGHSHAGAIVLRYAERYPKRVARLVLISAQIMDSPPNDALKNWITKRLAEPEYSVAAQTLMSLGSAPPQTDEEFAVTLDKLLPWYFSDVDKVDLLKQHMAETSDQLSLYAFKTNKNDSQEENKLPHIEEGGLVEAKTLIIWGEEDAICSLVAANAIAEAIKGSKLKILPGIGHLAWIEAPDAFKEEFLSFTSS